MGDAQVSAMKRAREAMQMKRGGRATPPKPPEEMTEAERQERENATDLQEMLEKSLASIRERAEDAQTSEEQRRQLENMAQNMQRMLDQASEQNPDARDWERIAESDQAKAILRALAKGEAIPDDQWNKLLSTLDDGLWQVRGKTPPEVYRRAIEQYQDRIRQLMTTISDDAD